MNKGSRNCIGFRPFIYLGPTIVTISKYANVEYIFHTGVDIKGKELTLSSSKGIVSIYLDSC